MKLLKSDLSRNFMIGFIAGTMIALFQFNPDLAHSMVPQTVASILP